MRSPSAPEPIPARADDAPALHTLREALARWQQSRGITQWTPGEVSQAQILEQIQRAEWWVLHQEDHLAAAVRVLTQDPLVWPDSATARATYVHGLMVARTASAQGLGARLLAWAETRSAALGHDRVRLDCVSTNHRLRAYYEHRGYRPHGQVTFGPDSTWHPVTRYEKPLLPRPRE
ncbi:GNAT family N-acetyltransferase [Nocardiopsis ganjiahuensis]|uniref:GNAT family N-acetyltransferase n=1 Tax=Nocardiopsis ganjiahuensis TaxID=239984 RepID=UPI000349BD0C|nr:GNAT family N-acetyltransferase [Nocardiopsis ganjiahuensis]